MGLTPSAPDFSAALGPSPTPQGPVLSASCPHTLALDDGLESQVTTQQRRDMWTSPNEAAVTILNPSGQQRTPITDPNKIPPCISPESPHNLDPANPLKFNFLSSVYPPLQVIFTASL